MLMHLLYISCFLFYHSGHEIGQQTTGVHPLSVSSTETSLPCGEPRRLAVTSAHHVVGATNTTRPGHDIVLAAPFFLTQPRHQHRHTMATRLLITCSLPARMEHGAENTGSFRSQVQLAYMVMHGAAGTGQRPHAAVTSARPCTPSSWSTCPFIIMLGAAAHGVPLRDVHQDTAIHGVMLDAVASHRAPTTASTQPSTPTHLRQHSFPTLSKHRRGEALLHRLVLLR